jgi:hypothetical protein
MVMPTTKEECSAAAASMGMDDFKDATGQVENSPMCAVLSSGPVPFVRWDGKGSVTAAFGGPWSAVCKEGSDKSEGEQPTGGGDGDGGDATPRVEEFSVSFSVAASGDVADYTPAIKDSLAGTVAAKAKVDKSKVGVDVTAGSVKIEFTITAATSAAAATAGNAVQASVADASAATTFFSTVPGITIIVASVTAISAPVSTAAGSSPLGAIVGAVVVVLCVVVGVYCYLKKKKRADPSVKQVRSSAV